MKFVLKRFPLKIDEQYLSISNSIAKIRLWKRMKCFKVISSQLLLLINIWKCNCFLTRYGIHSIITLIPVYYIYFARNEILVFWMNISFLPNFKKICNVNTNNRWFTTYIAIGILRENYFKHNYSKHANHAFVHIKTLKTQIFWSRRRDKVRYV